MKTVTGKGAVIALTGLSFMLAGCGGSTTEKDFLCPVVSGGSPCSTISAADTGGGTRVVPVRERFSDTLGKELSQTPLGVGSGKGSVGAGAGLSAMGDGGMAYSAYKYRVPEQVGTLWIAPHQDADGLLHEARFVHFVVREPRWASGRP